MRNPFEKSKTPIKTREPKKTIISQEELRNRLEQRLNSLKPTLQAGIKEYEEALKDGVFEDNDDEQEGEGEKRKESIQKRLDILFDQAERMKVRLDSKEPLSQVTPEISTSYTHPDGKQETITLDIEAKLQDFLSFYQKTGIDIPPDFEDAIHDIWERNQVEI